MNRIVYAHIILLWWIAMWGYSELLVETWTREEKFTFYTILLFFVFVCMFLFPKEIF